MTMDRIEKKILLRAPRSRVWRAIARAEEFGAWFGVKLDGASFAPAALVQEHLFSYRWHPYPEPGVDHSREPTTLVEFRLEDAAGGTLLTVVESGFDRIPLARREQAFRMNEHGWSEQLKNVERHVSA